MCRAINNFGFSNVRTGYLPLKMSRFGSVVLLGLLLLVSSASSSQLSTGPHIADVNILLPPRMTHPVEYRLQGSDGCFKWSWDHHDILSVLPEYNLSSHCSTSARLRSIAPYSGRKETSVYATDVHTGMIIRCKVFIDNFSRIQIFHNSIKLDLDGLATLRVRAFDDEENVFSSLAGLQFMWQLMSEANGLSHHLVHVPLKDSPLGDCGGFCGDLDIQIQLEDSGVFSDLYVVKGAQIGHQTVSVHLLEPQFEHMEDKIVLTVAEAMSLDPPSPVFVLIGATVHYCLKVMRGNIPQVVSLPSPFHRWSVLNSSVSGVDTMTGLTNAWRLGVTSVIVEDTRVAGHMQMSSLHVVLPDTLRLYMLPLSYSGEPIDGISPIPSVSCWFVVSGRSYLILLKVFSQGPGAQEIYITESDDIKLHEDWSGHWNTLLVSDDIAAKSGLSYSRILKATSNGLGKMTATLTYSTGDDETKEVLKVVQEVMVCDHVKFSIDHANVGAQSILLPWAPTVYQELDLKVTGGCAKLSSDYKWFSSDMATVSVSAYGVVQAKKPGKAIIKVVSIFDSFNYDEVVIEVSTPSSMVMLPKFPVETVVGSHLQAAVTLKASNGAYFYRCDAFSSSIKWKTGSHFFTLVNVTDESFAFDILYGPPCASTYIYASGSGHTMLQAVLTKEYLDFDRSRSSPVVLKASWRIAAHPPLTLHQAGDGNQFGGYWFDLAQAEANNQLEKLDDLYLVPGTYLDVMLHGGPDRWGQGVEFIHNVETLDEQHNFSNDGVIIHQISAGYSSPYRIACLKLGTCRLVFKRGNLVGDDHPLPTIAEVDLMLRCSFPSSIVLIADERVNKPDVIWSATKAERNPGRIRVTPITVANGRTIRISAVGISNSGKAFGNSSSLYLRWELHNCDGLAYWDDTYDLATSKSSWERFLALQNASGLCTVSSTVAGFSDNMSGYHSTIPFQSSEGDLTDTVHLQLVSTLRIEPEFGLLFFHNDAKLNLSITGGSCFLDAVVNNSQVVEVIQPPPPSGLQCLQLLLAPKGLGAALVTVYDIGLSPPLAAASLIRVADVDWIKISTPEELSLMEGTLQSIDILAGLDDGTTFDSSQYVYMSIRIHIEDHIVELADSDDFRSSVNGYVKVPSFLIRAGHIGVTTLYVSARQQSGREIFSQRIKVEVYAPPKLHPSDIFLVPGASYVLTVKGGPTIGSYVEYACMNDKTATVHKSSGKLSAVSPGNTTVIATVYGYGDAMICQARGQVNVGIPSSMILNVQSDQLAIDHEMPIFPYFPEGNLFSFYELCKNYKWTIDDEKVLSFEGINHLHDENYGSPIAELKEIKSSSYLDEKDLGFIEVLRGRSSGKTEVAVSFSCDFDSSGSFPKSRTYTASTSLWVISDLPLALGAQMTWVLPPHYTSSNLLSLPFGSSSQYDSQNQKRAISYSILRQCGESDAVQNDAISIDGDRIRTKDSNNLACIQAKDRSTGRLEVASCIRVAEVSQIRIATNNFRRIDLAVGSELEIPVSYCDILGIPFHEAYNATSFDAESNYPDTVSINFTNDGNGNIRLKAMRHGRALVRVSFNNNPKKSDYVMVSVGAHLYPQNPVLQLGSQLNFSVKGINDQVSGGWFSSNGSVLSVDLTSGKAEAVGEGSTQVIFEDSSLKLQTSVTVLKGDIVSINAPIDVLTNVPFPAKGYSFPLKFSDSQHKYEVPQNGVQVLYDCRVDPSFVGYAKPWKDLDTGNSYCLFFPYSPEHLAHSAPKLKVMGQGISVSVAVSIRGTNQISGSASALFVGGFSILEMDKNSMRLNLTAGSNRSIITIVGNTDVEVHWQDRNHLLINPIRTEELEVGGHVQYEVKAIGPQEFKDKVIITLPANSQRVEIDVNYEPGGRAASGMASNVVLWSGILVSTVILMATVTLFIFCLDRPDRLRPPTAPATPIVTALATPVRGSPGAVVEHSPRTPQPFIEYVRRTIDETPYYRREGRRRMVNPQNTF
ncbi:nuclear pore complex protein GP210 isoform X2 [Diospyros lotus]|uniref:nuclear pore complex protein GP210 isoform X2 n=1 Tax=Diospyros lotus TaxID=55363 RepID=UPI00224E2F49|nr:nuclear pore complex protein GP210 isoform X2 [Diospyros lotus]